MKFKHFSFFPFFLGGGVLESHKQHSELAVVQCSGVTPGGYWGTTYDPGVKPDSGACKASTLPALLLLWPTHFTFQTTTWIVAFRTEQLFRQQMHAQIKSILAKEGSGTADTQQPAPRAILTGFHGHETSRGSESVKGAPRQVVRDWEKWGVSAHMSTVSFQGDKYVLKLGGQLPTSVNVLKMTALHSLNEWTVAYMNCISKSCYSKRKEKEKLKKIFLFKNCIAIPHSGKRHPHRQWRNRSLCESWSPSRGVYGTGNLIAAK